jgi:hypothetical protein
MNSVNNNLGQMFFLHSAGGCGKTFVCNTIAAAVRAQRKVALCSASSGIAALLLDGGRTAHSTFGIKVKDLDETSMCTIKRDSEMHEVLKQTAIIIWDEVPMQHKYALESVNRTIKDFLKNLPNSHPNSHQPFGGITMLFGGDFRQTLPVIPKGSRQQIVSASIKNSSFWRQVKMYYLRQNMRLEQTPDNVAFADWLLSIGAGLTVDDKQRVEIPQNMLCIDNSVASLINAIYPDIVNEKLDRYFMDRTLLCGTNNDVDDINTEILKKFPGEEKVLHSTDSVGRDETPYPVEYLNSIKASGLPLAKLALKAGCPIMLLRNLDPARGLCNGTRLRVLQIRPRCLQCQIMSGDGWFAGKIEFIPRITLEPSGEGLPIALRRHQFPVRLAFSMMINKSQGQSVKEVGINLQSPVFSHGQLYVGLSRCTSGNRVKVLLNEKDREDGRTANIVYKEMFSRLEL